LFGLPIGEGGTMSEEEEADEEYLESYTHEYDQKFERGEIDQFAYMKLRRLAGFQDTFQCQRCGRCCKEMDAVAFTMADLRMVSERFGINPQQFIRKFQLKRVAIRGEQPQYLLKWEEGYSCPFHDGSGCTIYEVRPDVCRRYPFLTSEGITRTLGLKNGVWFYGAQCKASVDHTNKVQKALGGPNAEPDEETKARIEREETGKKE
jgi:Fe-S-cluster containining protein